MAERIQRKRIKGWRMPPNTVYVGRPSQWGNPYDHRGAAEVGYGDGYGAACDCFRAWLRGDPMEVARNGPPPTYRKIRAALKGKNLACWCPLDRPCHADVLLELAND